MSNARKPYNMKIPGKQTKTSGSSRTVDTLTLRPCIMRRTEERGPSHDIRTDTALLRRLSAASSGCGWAAAGSARPRKPERRGTETETDGGSCSCLTW